MTLLITRGDRLPLNRYELACMIAAAHGVPTERLRRRSIAKSGLERAAHCVLDSSRAGAPAEHAAARGAG